MRPLARSLLLSIVFAAAIASASTPVASAAPVAGFVEDFTGVGTGGWAGGPGSSNPGTGGVGGSGDGYLYVQTLFAGNWGNRCRLCPEYTGSWSAAGIHSLKLWLNDVGPDEAFEIHVAIGNDHNLWQYDTGFAPPNGSWAEFTVDLDDAAGFTQTIGTQPFAEAIDSVNVLLIRHDKAPYLPNPNPPDPIAGDAGIDRIQLLAGTAGIEPPSGGPRPVLLAPPHPNPARGGVAFMIENPGGGAVTLEILDVLGRVVRREALPGGPGTRSWSWNRIDDTGRRAPPGVYRVRARGASGGTSRPFTLID